MRLYIKRNSACIGGRVHRQVPVCTNYQHYKYISTLKPFMHYERFIQSGSTVRVSEQTQKACGGMHIRISMLQRLVCSQGERGLQCTNRCTDKMHAQRYLSKTYYRGHLGSLENTKRLNLDLNIYKAVLNMCTNAYVALKATNSLEGLSRPPIRALSGVTSHLYTFLPLSIQQEPASLSLFGQLRKQTHIQWNMDQIVSPNSSRFGKQHRWAR